MSKDVVQLCDVDVCLLREKLRSYLIILFGSCAKGNIRPDSDIDIGYLSDQSITAYSPVPAQQTKFHYSA